MRQFRFIATPRSYTINTTRNEEGLQLFCKALANAPMSTIRSYARLVSSGSSSAIERYYRILRIIEEMLRDQAVVVHVPARPDRESQTEAIRETEMANRDRPDVIITSCVGDHDKILWPYEGLEVMVSDEGVQLLLGSPSPSPRAQRLIELCTQRTASVN